jgi:hypothetical protein
MPKFMWNVNCVRRQDQVYLLFILYMGVELNAQTNTSTAPVTGRLAWRRFVLGIVIRAVLNLSGIYPHIA